MEENKVEFNIPNEPEKAKSPLDSLKERMLMSKAANEAAENNSQDGFSVSSDNEDAKADEEKDFPVSEESDISEENFSYDEEFQPEEIPDAEEEPQKPRRSFLKRMRRYTTDDNGVDVTEDEKPLYELDSVNSILGIETEEDSVSEPEEEFLPDTSDEPDALPYISDIDRSETDYPSPDKPATSDTATIRFTPINDEVTKKTTVSVDTMTHKIDLSGEFTEAAPDDTANDPNFEQSDFERFVPDEEITDHKCEKRFLRNFAIKKRNAFLKTVLCGILTFVLFIFLFPSITNSMLNGSTGLMMASSVILGVVILINADMFLSFARFRTVKLNNDINASLAAISTILFAIFSVANEVYSFPIIFICSFTLFIRSLTTYYDASNRCDNLRVISVPRPKKAVTLISDTSTAVAMAKNSIEGDVLIASSKKTDRVSDFMKYSEYGEKLFGRIDTITAISLFLAVACAVVTGLIKHSIVESFYVSSVILLLTAIPIVFFIDSLPLRSMTDRLTRRGAMLSGFAAADRLNQANAVVIRTADLFPSGTVVLKDMKILSENSVDDIILRSASVTDALSSPLSTIFKQIAKTNAAYDVPDSDTVKYEERLGISGWVNNERLFIGNRTLMEAHGIEVPSLEIDRNILKKGYFPVYVSKDDTACVLLVVKYSVDPAVAKQLRDATSLGITVLIDNSDPNISAEMIADYFGLDESLIHVMTSVGSNIHKTATAPVDECSSGAAYKGNSLSLLSILTAAYKLKRSNMLLTVIYCIASVLGIIYFVYSSFLGNTQLIERALTVLIYEIAATAVSLTAFMIKRP